MKTGRFGKTYEHPRWGGEYIGPYSGSYGATRNLLPRRFKFLGNDFDPDKMKDPNPNSEYKNGNLQCTNYSEIKQGGSVALGVWQWLAIQLGLIDPRDALMHPILGDRENDSDYKPDPTVPGLSSPPKTYTLNMTQPMDNLLGRMTQSDWLYSDSFGTEIVVSQSPI